MSESSNGSASEGHQSGSGDSAAGGLGGDAGQSAADAFAAERESLTRKASDWQGKHDRAVAELQSLQQQLAQYVGDDDGEDDDDPGYMTVEDFRAELARQREFDKAKDGLREQFPMADPEVYELADEFESPEDFAEVVEMLHKEAEESRAAMRQEVEAEVRAEYEKQFGKLRTAPATTDNAVPGALTVERAAEMSLSEFRALSKEDRAALLQSTFPSNE